MAEEEARELVSRAVTDPSSLTTSALHRAIEDVKELFNIQLAGEIKSQNARIAAIEKAAEVFSESLTRVPTSVDRAVGDLRALHQEKFAAVEKQFGDFATLREEKFHAIQTQFSERDIRTEQISAQAALAINAALQAAKEAVAEQNRSSALAIQKSELSTVKAIDAQGVLIATTAKAQDDKLDDLKERLTRLEANLLGTQSQKQEQHGSSSFIVGLVGVGLAIISALIALSAFIRPGK